MSTAEIGQPYYPPVPSESYGTFSFCFLLAGFVIMSIFFIDQMKATKETRSVVRELIFAVPSSIMLGLGTLFLFLWAGIYV